MKSKDLLDRQYSKLEAAEAELERRHGERYRRYRREYEAAGRFDFEPEFPLYLMLEQTFRCNLRCPSCIHAQPEASSFDPGVTAMPRELFDRIVLEGEAHACPSLSVHGNDEPLLVHDLAERLAFAAEHGFMDLFMTTNGVFLEPERMKPIVDAGITRILFSVDAATPETYDRVRPNGDFAKVLANMKALQAYKREKGTPLPAVRASFVPTALNVHERARFVHLFSGLADFVEVQPFAPYYGRNMELVPRGAYRLEGWRCNEPWRKLIVRANGDALPCCNFYAYELPVGNVYETTLADIFQGERMRTLRREFKDGVFAHEACRTCAEHFYKI